MVRDIGGGEVTEIRWRPPTKAEVREIVRRYHEAQAKVPPFKVVEFERPLNAGDVDRDGAVAERPVNALLERISAGLNRDSPTGSDS